MKGRCSCLVAVLAAASGCLPAPAHAHADMQSVSWTFASAPAPRPAALRVSDRVAPPGTRVRLRGRRFAPSARAAIRFGGFRLRVVRTHRDGTLRTAIRVPGRLPGVYTVSARTGRRVARVRFRVPRPAPMPVGTLPPTAPPAQPAGQPPPPPADPSPVTMVAAGDIACKPGAEVMELACHHGAVSDRVLALDPDVVAPLGDVQYEHATAEELAGSYDPTWGRFKAITRPVPGNHEYEGVLERDSADGYYDYFGAAAGIPEEGYYTYEIGDWQAIALNTGALGYTRNTPLPEDCHPVSCAAGSEQELWLRGVLDSLPPDKCVVAYWHHPRYSSTNPFNHPELTAIYDALRDGGAEVALTGHSHAYERFARMDADGSVDSEHGVREFVVGTGGRDRRFADAVEPFEAGSEFRLPNAAGFGVLELELGAGRYEFRLVGEGGEILDEGSDSCHGRP